MVKLTKRKGFNFFRSYYDVYNELSDKDKVTFMDALLDRQFLGIKPTELKGMAKFAYISQTNSIDSQVKGYEDKTGTKLLIDPTVGVNEIVLTPTIQVQVEGKEKVEEKVQVQEEDKVEEFKNSLRPHVPKYGVELITKFFDYWSETNTNGKKMRFEYAKNQPFNIDRRLSTWSNRDQSFKPKQKQDRL